MSQQLVKERVIKYLMEDLLVPHDMIDTDVPLSEFEEGAEGVLDIIVNVTCYLYFIAKIKVLRATKHHTTKQTIIIFDIKICNTPCNRKRRYFAHNCNMFQNYFVFQNIFNAFIKLCDS